MKRTLASQNAHSPSDRITAPGATSGPGLSAQLPHRVKRARVREAELEELRVGFSRLARTVLERHFGNRSAVVEDQNQNLFEHVEVRRRERNRRQLCARVQAKAAGDVAH